MIEIRLWEAAQARPFFESAGVPPCENGLAYEAREQNGSLGTILFAPEGERGAIFSVRMSQEGLLPIADGLIRSALSLLFGRGVRQVICEGGVEPVLLRGVGFRELRRGMWSIALTERFFMGCENR